MSRGRTVDYVAIRVGYYNPKLKYMYQVALFTWKSFKCR